MSFNQKILFRTLLLMTKAVILVLSIGAISCVNNVKSPIDSIKAERLNKSGEMPTYLAISNDKFVDTRYKYVDSIGMNLIIENSLPKGGLKYTDQNGKEYIYAVFWTRIINQTRNRFELTINFPNEWFELPSSGAIQFKILLPSDTLTVDKEPLFNYGLTNLKSFLDNNIHKSFSLNKAIDPKESKSFYVLTLFNQGLNDTLRTGLSLNGQDLFYRVRDKKILCGKTSLRNLVLQK